MKRIIPAILLLSFVACFVACNKDKVNISGDQVGVSKVTHYAVFQMSGDPYVSVVQGGTYTEPGVTATSNGSPVPVVTTGTVNTSQVGLYTINYSAYNKDSFASTASRTVVVIPAHETPGTDLSGQYKYVGSSSYTSTVTKVAEGVYTTDNAWSGATVIPLVFISVNGTDIIVPVQSSAYGPLDGTGTFDPATGRLVYTLDLSSQGISGSNRTWQKL